MIRLTLPGGRTSGLLTALLTVITLVADVRPASAQTPSPDLANFLKSRHWWQDAGSFGDQAWGIVRLFAVTGTHRGEGWYDGTQASFRGYSEGSRLGVGWYPFEYEGYYGVFVDRAFAWDWYLILGYDEAAEGLFVYGSDGTGGESYDWWLSTRSPYTPQRIRNLYYR